MTACDDCLRRTDLIAAIAGRLQVAFKSRRAPARVLALPDDALLAVAAGPEAARRYARFDAAAARRAADAAGLVPICRCSAAYPRRLLDLPDPPAVLHVLGEPAVLEEGSAVAVVGARRASTYGTEVARALGRGLSVARVAVVSGLALGVDSAAHAGALDGPGATIGVLAGSAHVPYPARGHRLHAAVARRGAVVSELPPGAPAHRWCFVARNRIIAALSAVTVVVQAAERSGSLTTADFAADIGRGVGAVPGQITSQLAVGTNGLIQAGAALVAGVADVLELLGAADGALPTVAAPNGEASGALPALALPDGETRDAPTASGEHACAAAANGDACAPPAPSAEAACAAAANDDACAPPAPSAEAACAAVLPGEARNASAASGERACEAAPDGAARDAATAVERGESPRRTLAGLRAAGTRAKDIAGLLGASDQALAAVLAPEPPPGELVELLRAVEDGRGMLGELAETPEEARVVLAGLGRLERLGFVRRGFGGRWQRTA